MRLPEHIYTALKPHMAHHAPWHVARRPGNEAMRGPGTAFPTLLGLLDVGSGEQFLRFHRDMVRVFKWVLANTPGPAYTYTPWPELPPFVADLFEANDPGFLAGVYSRTIELVAQSTAEQLGAFIEATLTSTEPRRGLHDSTHGAVDQYEVGQFGAGAAGLKDARMNAFGTAPHNEHFWGLHGWIDERFADWQRAHGEAVDQSPLPPSHHLHGLMGIVPAPVEPHTGGDVLRPHWMQPHFLPARGS